MLRRVTALSDKASTKNGQDGTQTKRSYNCSCHRWKGAPGNWKNFTWFFVYVFLNLNQNTPQNLKSTLSKRDSLNNKILNTSNIFSSMYENNPRMIPKQFIPECHKIHIVALPKTPNAKDKRKKKVNKKIEASGARPEERESYM